MPFADPEVRRAYHRERWTRRRAAYLAGKCCAWCGATDDLQVHHRDPEKKGSHRIWSWSQQRLEAELAKCEIVCAPCHAKAHAEARRIEAELRNPCGTYQAYARGCRCDACRAARRDIKWPIVDTERTKAA